MSEKVYCKYCQNFRDGFCYASVPDWYDEKGTGYSRNAWAQNHNNDCQYFKQIIQEPS